MTRRRFTWTCNFPAPCTKRAPNKFVSGTHWQREDASYQTKKSGQQSLPVGLCLYGDISSTYSDIDSTQMLHLPPQQVSLQRARNCMNPQAFHLWGSKSQFVGKKKLLFVALLFLDYTLIFKNSSSKFAQDISFIRGQQRCQKPPKL